MINATTRTIMMIKSSSSSKYERDVSSCRCCAYLESSHPRRRRGNGDIILILPPPSTNFAFLFLLYPTRSPSPTSRGRCRCCCTAMTLFFALLRSDITSSSSSSHRAIFLLFFPVNFLNGRRQARLSVIVGCSLCVFTGSARFLVAN